MVLSALVLSPQPIEGFTRMAFMAVFLLFFHDWAV
jgi:hypothetical protein